MRKITIFVCMLFSVNAFGEKTSSVNYNCRFEWQTMSDPLIVKNIVGRDLISLEIKKGLSVSLKLLQEESQIKVTEFYTDGNPKNFLEYNFSCNRNLTCKGERVNAYDGKSTTTPFVILPSSRMGVGTIQERELFRYMNQVRNDFIFNYILYKDQAGKPMGLKVDCKEHAKS